MSCASRCCVTRRIRAVRRGPNPATTTNGADLLTNMPSPDTRRPQQRKRRAARLQSDRSRILDDVLDQAD